MCYYQMHSPDKDEVQHHFIFNSQTSIFKIVIKVVNHVTLQIKTVKALKNHAHEACKNNVN